MVRAGAVALALAIAAALVARPASRARAGAVEPASQLPGTATLTAPPAPERPPVRLHASPECEEELQARVIEDERVRTEIFDEFRAETDGERLDFLQNALASHPPLRNDPAWQERFMAVAEHDPLPERRAAALLFLQQAETVRAVHDRLLALAEHGGDLRKHALVALKGLPDRRAHDPALASLVARMLETERDPDLRALAARLSAP